MPHCRERYIALVTHGPKGLPGVLILWGLRPLSCLFGRIVALRSRLYHTGWIPSHRAGVPVISVGNLAVGGTGKTPVVDALVKQLIKRGLRVAVVSRGYGGSFKGKSGRVTPAGGEVSTPEVAGDEPFLLALKNPDACVYVARKRRFGVAAAEADGAECIVLDDAFQHLAVARDLDVVLLDARNPFGNGLLLPAGLLREPRSALKRADLLILTHSAERDDSLLKESATTVRCRHRLAGSLIDAEGCSVPWSQVAGSRCLAFAGIARPDDFFLALQGKGCVLLQAWPLADHQKYDPALLKRISKASQAADFILTTEKDAVKLKGAGFPRPCLTVPLELAFEQVEILEKSLDKVLQSSAR